MAYISFQPTDYFGTLLYSGNSSTQALTGLGFEPDLIWIKNRDGGGGSHDHYWFDQVRGTTKHLRSNTTNAEGTASGVTSFDSDGFTLGSSDGMNESSRTFVAWNWKASGTSGSSNSNGSITTTVSADTTRGFSIVKWVCDNQNPSTLGHGLGAVPSVILMKEMTGSSGWVIGGFGLDWGGYLSLQTTNALSNNGNNTTGDGRMFYQGGNAPTSTIWYTNSGAIASQNGATMIAYCFAEKKGFSKFGSYLGNGSASGSFVYCGFKPAMVLFKQSSASGEKWYIYDNKRNTHNVTNSVLFPNAADAESPTTTGAPIDILSNGFKLRGTDAAGNGDGSTYVFMAFAEHPIVSSNGVPVTAK